MNHWTEFVTGQNFLDSFSCHGVLYIGGVEATFGLWSFLIILTKQPTNSGLKIQKITGIRDCKSCPENVSLSLAKRKLAEKNEWEFSNQVGKVLYPSIYLINRRSFFYIGYLI